MDPKHRQRFPKRSAWREQASGRSLRSIFAIGAVMLLMQSTVGCSEDDGSLLAEYDVSGSSLEGAVEDSHREVWDRFNQLFPDDTHPEISKFMAIDAEATGGADGYLSTRNDDGTDFELALDTTNAFGKKSLEHTMIHEFAHLFSLRSGQLDFESPVGDCDSFHVGEGCPLPSSYLHQYFAEFWSGYTAETAEEEPESAADDRFATGDFHTDYAATAPSEDFAEAFAFWVVADSLPDDGSVTTRKMRFFEQFAELNEVRDTARESLG